MTRSISFSVTTGILYPLPTLESIHHLNELGIHEIELTLQPNEFHLTFERTLRMPILPELNRLVKEGRLRIRSMHAPAILHEHANHLWARKQYILPAIEICRILGASMLVVHPYASAAKSGDHSGISLREWNFAIFCPAARCIRNH